MVNRLSYLIQMEEDVVQMISKKYNMDYNKAREMFIGSKTYNKMYQSNSIYYSSGCDSILKDFIEEHK